MKTAITPTRAEDYPEWYQAVVKAAELAEHSPVRGCMVVKPWGYALWERVQAALDGMIKATGHDNVAMPTLLPLAFFEQEAKHVEGFAKETMVMTHYRLKLDEQNKLVPDPSSKLEEPYVLRPTSELMFGHMYSKWVQSYRDLPIKLNQWGSVFRWEMRTRLFLRTAEFIWQEGHTAHATREEAIDETSTMLEVYEHLLHEYLAIDTICGYKTVDELFPGAEHTLSSEAMMQDKKALQASTSHFLGQNFAKACQIQFLDQAGEQQLAHTTSWGASTRMIGGLIMSHSDDDGLVLPPRLAPAQIIILPIYKNEQERDQVMPAVTKLVDELRKLTVFDEAVRVKVDDRELRGGEKKWQAVKQGVPIRIELGPKDIAKQQVCFARRDHASNAKQFLALTEVYGTIQGVLLEMQQGLFARSRQRLNQHTRAVDSLEAFERFFKEEGGFAIAFWCEAAIDHPLLTKLKVTPRCIPLVGSRFRPTQRQGICIFTGEKTGVEVVFGLAY